MQLVIPFFGETKGGRHLLLCTFLAFGVLALDASLPRGIATGVLYVGVVLVCLWSPFRYDAILVAAVCTILLALGIYLSLSGGDGWFVLANRLLSLLAIWVTASLVWRRKSDLQQREQRLREQMAVLVDLGKSPNLGQGKLEVALVEIAEAAARFLKTARVGIWLYRENSTRLQCVEQYELETHKHSQGAVLEAEKYPHYFAAVDQERLIAAHDAANDPRTCEFSDSYLVPLGITSMLDAAIHLRGEMVGVLCHEHIGSLRTWSLDEQQFAGAIAEYVDLALEAYQRSQAEELQRGRNHLLERLAAGADLDEILKILIQTTERIQPDLIGSVLIVDRESQCLRHGAALSLPDFYNEAVDGLKIGPNVGSCGAAAYSGERVIVEDIQTHPNWADFRELADRAGVRACWSEPIFDSAGTTLGTFAMYYRAPRGPNESDLQLIRSAAHLAGIAIERKSAEAELRKAHHELESRVQKRTAELVEVNDKLAEQARELAQSNKDLERFAYVASHDLQEPLRAVAGHCKLLQQRYQGKLDSDADEFLTHAVEGATRMKSLIDALLTYSRAGTRVGEHALIDCDSVLQEALENLDFAIAETDAKVTSDSLPSVYADRLQLVELWQNLVGNAIKYRGDKPPIVHVGVEAHDEEWVFSVRDQGIGIPPDHLDRIFVMFQRLHTRDEYPGTGVGLAICQRIVDRLGGEIWVESDEGSGSTFYFTIPTKANA